MSQHRLRVPEPEGLGSKRTSSEDNLYLAVLRASEGKKDERDRVQKKTFTKWVNKHLIKAQRHISDLYEDLRDGHNLISLLEVLSGDSLPREKGRMRFHKLQNVQIALDYLRHRQVKLVNIRNDDIADGNPKLTTLRLQLEETDHQKSILDEELQRLKAEVTEAARQRSQVEEELFSVRVQMEELGKLKARIEAENRALILRDKDNTQRFLEEEAEKMKQVAEEAARLSVAAQEAARLRQLAEEDLAQQRALAEKMLKEKMQAVQEATRLKAEAELLQQQKELAQEQARRLQEDKEQMAQQLVEEMPGRTLT